MVNVQDYRYIDALLKCETQGDRDLLAQELRKKIFWGTLQGVLDHVRNEQWDVPGSHAFHEHVSKKYARLLAR